MLESKKSSESISISKTAAVCAVTCLTSLFAAMVPAFAFELVTKAEAELPAGTIPTIELRGSPTRRPNVVIVSPAPNAGTVYSPVTLKLRFHAFGGAQIDPDSVVVTYIKQPAIDITQRLMPFITANGINISQAEVPLGLHQFWIELKDMDGRIGGAPVNFQVVK